MRLVGIFNKIICVAIIWGNLFSPIFACHAASGLDSVWAEETSTGYSEVFMPIKVEGLAELGTFLVYILVIFTIMFAFVSIFIGGVKRHLASGNEDIKGEAHHAIITGLVSFVVALGLFFSLNQVFSIVRELAEKVA